MKKPTQIVVKQVEDAPVTAEVLAQEIIAISAGIKRLRAGKLNERALLLLISNAAPTSGTRYAKKPVSQKTVKAVLDGIASLESEYIQKPSR